VSITTYDELKSSIADFLDRDDLTSVIPTFISLAEARIARDLRHWKQEKRVTADMDERYENLPNDWVEIQQVQITDGGRISFISASDMAERRALNDTSGKPRYMRLTAYQLELYPTPDATYEVTMQYYGRIPALSALEPDNWLLRDAPDVFLYGALMHSAPYLAEDARTTIWANLYQSGIQALNLESEKAHAAGPLRMRIPT